MNVLDRLLSHNTRAPSRSTSGFSLPELLVATTIAALISAVTGQFMISQLLEERRLEVAQGFREDVSRLNYLIQIEASEATEIELNAANASGCNNVGGADAFALAIPRPTGRYSDDSNLSRIRYYNANDDGIPAIWRCGPPVTRNGVLIHNATPTNTLGIVMRNAQLSRPDGCEPSTVRSISYRVTPTGGLAGANLGNLGGCSTAHARSVFVCNPPIIPDNPADYVQQVGDCPLP